jgi:hypothetical protein
VIHIPPQTRMVEASCPLAVRDRGVWDRAALCSEIRDFLNRHFRFVVPAWLDICATYVFMSWVFERCRSVPYLRARVWRGQDDADQRHRPRGPHGDFAGKRPRPRRSSTCSIVFAARWCSTKPIFKSDMTADIVKILNAGYRKTSQSYVPRRSADNFDPRVSPCTVRTARDAREIRRLGARIALLHVPDADPGRHRRSIARLRRIGTGRGRAPAEQVASLALPDLPP